MFCLLEVVYCIACFLVLYITNNHETVEALCDHWMAKMSAIFTNRRSFNGKVIWLYVVSLLESLRNKDQNIWSSCLILFLSSLNLTVQFPSPVNYEWLKYLKALCFHTCRSESVFVMEYPNGLNPKSTIVRFISYVDDLLIQSLLVMCDSVMKSI